ncbi:MAG: hypothetical protein Q9217_001911 [Psora testacea]
MYVMDTTQGSCLTLVGAESLQYIENGTEANEGNEQRSSPRFEDRSGIPPAVPSYTAAINHNLNANVTSLEFSFYSQSLSQALGIPPRLSEAVLAERKTPYRGQRFYGGTVRREDDPKHTTSNKRTDSAFEKEPGFYRILYDWEHGEWTTQVAGETQRNGSFSIGHRDLVFRDLVFADLHLWVPNFALFARSCKYDPFLQIFRTDNQAASNINTPVLRTTAPGGTQKDLEICAQRQDVIDPNGAVLMRGLEGDLPVVAGLVAAWRYREWNAGRRKGCKGRWLNK